MLIDWFIFRVGGRNRIGFGMRAENHLFSVWASNLTSFLCGRSKLTSFQCWDWNWLGVCVGIEIDSVCVLGSKMTWFWCLDRNWRGFSVGIEMDLFFVQGSELILFLLMSKLTWFWCADRNWPGLCGGSNLTWFQCKSWNWDVFVWGRKRVGFSVWIEIDRVLCRGILIDLILEWGSKLTWFQRWVKINLIFCGGDRIALRFLWLIKIDVFQSGDRTWHYFRVSIQKYLVFSVGIEIGLVFVCGPKLTSF